MVSGLRGVHGQKFFSVYSTCILDLLNSFLFEYYYFIIILVGVSVRFEKETHLCDH